MIIFKSEPDLSSRQNGADFMAQQMDVPNISVWIYSTRFEDSFHDDGWLDLYLPHGEKINEETCKRKIAAWFKIEPSEVIFE